MWDDIEIGGKGTKDFGNSAIKVFGIQFQHISENRISYWVSCCIGGTGMRVMKDTKEGVTIKLMIEENWSEKKMLNYFNRLLIKKLSPTKLLTIIDNIKKEEYEKGKKDNLMRIQDALGIPNKYYQY